MAGEQVLCESPRVVVYDHFLSTEEIDRLLKLGEPLWEPTTVVSNETGQSVVDGYRTGKLVHLNKVKDQLLEKIKQQIAAMTGTREVQCEYPQLVKYDVGDEYKVHHDWFDPLVPGPKANLKSGGQRIKSAIVCLKEAEEGGETNFPNLAIKVKLKPGQAVVFDDIHMGEPTLLTDHAGLPVIKGEKIVMPLWIRERAADGSEESAELTLKQIAAQKIMATKAAAKVAAEAADRAVQVEAEHRVATCAGEMKAIAEKYRCRLYGRPQVELLQNGQLRMSATVELDAILDK